MISPISGSSVANAMSPPQTYRLAQVLGTGAYGLVFQAVEANSGNPVALKKSRVSQRVKRTVLRYESRILQLLQSHPAIPAIYGYGQLPRFEYLAMELLGPSVNECATGPVAVTTVARVVLQWLSALEHIHKHGFVHRDIKPDNVLCSRTDPTRVFVIDFGISGRIKPGPPTSLNAHNGVGLGPRDDLESLAYTAFFLLRGDLPWGTPDSHRESVKEGMKRIQASKAAASGDKLGTSFPPEFASLLNYSRGLKYDQTLDYMELKRQFTDLVGQVGGKDAEGPLHGTSVGISIPKERNGSEIARSEVDDAESDDEDENEEGNEEENFTNSYFNWDRVRGIKV